MTNAKSTVVGYERWASEEAHQQHLQGAHVRQLMARMADILAAPPTIVSYEAIDE
jgi:quinol monooxygenase YgiN